MDKKTPRYWEPLEKAGMGLPSQAYIAELRRLYPELKSDAEAIELSRKGSEDCTYYINNLYQVEVRPIGPNWVQINIRRRDGRADLRDWRHFQQIKNEIVGDECEAIEIYPAESRLVDTSNKFHLWACTDPTFRFPVGWVERDVQYEPSTIPGLNQRPL